MNSNNNNNNEKKNMKSEHCDTNETGAKDDEKKEIDKWRNILLSGVFILCAM